jgi:membrane-bound lytic murein transglycosylase A
VFRLYFMDIVRFFTVFSFCILTLAACTDLSQSDLAEMPDQLIVERVSYEELPGWGADDLRSFVPAFSKSCARILRSVKFGNADKALGPLAQAGTYGDWQAPCQVFLDMPPQASAAMIKQFFETHFAPHQVRNGAKAQGLFTGYYEASLRGSKTRSGPYQTPLYARADDLVMVQLGEFRDDLKGRRIAGRVKDGKLVPYEERAEIVAGDWPHNDKVLVWVDDPVDAFFVQIQGSGVVELAEGGVMRIGYAGQNGHPYYAIGRELINRGVLTKENVSLQSIRAWLVANPASAEEVMSTNASYVFFKALEGEGPLGGEGVALTAGRSLAVDRSLFSYGVPLWTDIELAAAADGHLRRMMVAQDTGGAIRGPVRGDVFWGHGARAEELAGPMKASGQYWMLLPRGRWGLPPMVL